MANKGTEPKGDSAANFYRRMDEHLDSLHETIKENLRTLPETRELVANHHAAICSLVDPEVVSRVDATTARLGAATAKVDAHLRSIKGQREAADRLLAKLRGGQN